MFSIINKFTEILKDPFTDEFIKYKIIDSLTQIATAEITESNCDCEYHKYYKGYPALRRLSRFKDHEEIPDHQVHDSYVLDGCGDVCEDICDDDCKCDEEFERKCDEECEDEDDDEDCNRGEYVQLVCEDEDDDQWICDCHRERLFREWQESTPLFRNKHYGKYVTYLQNYIDTVYDYEFGINMLKSAIRSWNYNNNLKEELLTELLCYRYILQMNEESVETVVSEVVEGEVVVEDEYFQDFFNEIEEILKKRRENLRKEEELKRERIIESDSEDTDDSVEEVDLIDFTEAPVKKDLWNSFIWNPFAWNKYNEEEYSDDSDSILLKRKDKQD